MVWHRDSPIPAPSASECVRFERSCFSREACRNLMDVHLRDIAHAL